MISCSENLTDKKLSQIDTDSVDPSFLIGEQIDGPANIRTRPNGKISFILNDGVNIETTPPVDNWLQVGLFIDLTPEQIKTSVILPGTVLTRDNKAVGKTIDTIDTWLDNGDAVYINGFSHTKNIKENSYPESYLTHLINQGNTSFEAFKDFMNQYKFEVFDGGSLTNLKEYFIYESLIVNPSPRDRISLLFNKDKLIGLVHSRPLQTQFKTFDLIRGHKLTVTDDLSEAEIKDIVDKKIKFYNSVD